GPCGWGGVGDGFPKGAIPGCTKKPLEIVLPKSQQNAPFWTRRYVYERIRLGRQDGKGPRPRRAADAARSCRRGDRAKRPRRRFLRLPPNPPAVTPPPPLPQPQPHPTP